MSLLDELFPYKYMRGGQEKVVRTIYKNYHKYDVFIIQAPVAFGKMGLAKFIMNLANHFGKTANYIHPDNILVKEAKKKFPDLPTLNLKRNYATGQAFADAKKNVIDSPQSTMNYHTLLANRIYKHTLVIDEAHDVFKMLQGMAGMSIWEHEPEYIDYGVTVTDLLLHLGEHDSSKAAKWKKHLTKHPDKYVVSYEEGYYKKEPRDCLKLVPLTVKDHPPVLWPPHKTRKIFLLSATISYKDIEDIGLSNRRVCKIEADSDIPHERRPFIYDPIMKVNFKNQNSYVARLAEHIEELAEEEGGKGLIHATYGIASRLRRYLSEDDRFMFHTKHDKHRALEGFMESDRQDLWLVGSGMSQGIDLEGDKARRQIITKCLFPNKSEYAIKVRAERDPEWYAWQAIREILQSYGRICRGPEDYGETRITDGMVKVLWEKYPHLWPKWIDLF